MLEKLEESFTAMWENISAWLARIEHRLDSFEKKVLEIHIRLEVLNIKSFAENLSKRDSKKI